MKLTEEQHRRFVEINAASMSPAPMDPFTATVLTGSPGAPLHPTDATAEVQRFGITGLAMHRSPWWSTEPVREPTRGEIRTTRGMRVACSAIAGEIIDGQHVHARAIP